MITVEQYAKALASLKGYFGVVGMFGGNPAVHPKFHTLCELLVHNVPYEQRGIWCNHPLGKGAIMRKTFNPAVSNLNVHQSQDAYNEFVRDWPECKPYLKGLNEDSRHGPPLVALSDVVEDEGTRWDMISKCDVNRYWSAIICVFRGELRAYFCELAGAQAMLHQDNPNWKETGQPMPDTGLQVEPGWWKRRMPDFAEQVTTHCHNCGIPLKSYGSLANGGTVEQVSPTHLPMVRLKRAENEIMLVTSIDQLQIDHLPKATDYIENGGI
jgi:hypothetical protein